MKVITNFSTYVPSEQGTSVAIGCFDGLHRAHQAVIGRTVADRSQGSRSLRFLPFTPIVLD